MSSLSAITSYSSNENIHTEDSNTSIQSLNVKRIEKPPWKKKSRFERLKFNPNFMKTEDIDKITEFTPDAPVNVLIRLRRTMESQRVTLTRSYMKTLAHKIEEDDEKIWERRRNDREEEGQEFFRKLAISGLMEPEPWMLKGASHPVFKTDRIMKRIEKNLDDYNNTTPDGRRPKIKPTEPFDEYDKTGILFGNHKDHYLKSPQFEKPLLRKSKSVGQVKEEEDENKEAFEEIYSFDNVKRQLSSGALSLATRILKLSESDLEKRYKEEQSKVKQSTTEQKPEAVERNKEEQIPESPTVWDGESGEQFEIDESIEARDASEVPIQSNKYNLDMQQLEKTFKPQRSRILDLIYKVEQEAADPLFNVGNSIINTFKREEQKGNEFVKQTLRKIIDSTGK